MTTWKNAPRSAKASARSSPTRPSRARVAGRSRHRSPRAERLPAARPRRRCAARRSWRSRSRANGIIQPIVVRRVGDRFQIIAGERRWRAAQARRPAARAGRRARRRAGQEQSLLEMALIENIQREDLNPIEEALAYRRLADEFQPDAGRHRRRGRQGSRVGRELPAAAEAARRSAQPRSRRAACRWATRARCSSLADEADQRRVARDVIARSLSVRETESLVKKLVEARQAARAKPPSRSRSTSTPAPPKIASSSCSAPASASSARARAAGSRSISSPRRS